MHEPEARSLVLLHLGWPRDRELVGDLLGESGADSLPTPAPAELRHMLAESRLDLILADTKGGRGQLDDLLQAIDACVEAGELPIVLLAEPEEVAGLSALVLRRPNALLLAKPVDPGQLRAAIGAGLRYRAGRRRERELLRQLSEANAELREADRKKDEFLAMLAHELRNPLSAIGNAAKLARRSQAQEHQEWSREVIEKHVASLSRMIDDLLDVSRITRGQIELRRQILDVLKVISQAIETVRPLVQERNHELTVSLSSSAPLWVEADPHRLEQVLVNLLNNAAKYTNTGGKIALTARREGDSVTVTVADNGTGIPPDRIPEMFQLFAQGDRSIARTEGGLGIGLTLVRNLVELHGGSVTARSGGLGKGSEFTVRLPAVKHAGIEPSAAARPGASEQPQKGARVLVVDDNEDSAKGMVRLLKVLGHEVETALDGPSAIEVARKQRPEFVLLDIGLPGMDGYQVAETLRAEGFTDATIIGVSGYGEEAARRRSHQAGFDHHLVKPVDYDRLVSLIRREHSEKG
jgi:signal transduction histidine kinase/CheY-like chemotaxis protein